MSDYTRNFPPQTYSSSFYINSLVDGEANILAKPNETDGNMTKGSPLLNCFISTMPMVLHKTKIVIFPWVVLLFLSTNAGKMCKLGDLNKIVVFSSLVDFQASTHSFNQDHPTFRGNVVAFNFKTIDRLVKNSFLSFDSEDIIKISLNNKGIKTIDDNAFNGLFCLHYLELRHNNLSSIRASMFIGIQNLWYLDLSENILQRHISENGMAFHILPNLKTLNLAKNMITVLNPNDFLSLFNLQFLNLSHNKISSIPPDLFLSFHSLQKLYLSNNQINIIEPEKWKNLHNLEVLDFHGNFLTNFDPSYNFSFVHLRNLNISNNFLKYLNIFALRKNLPELKVIDISNNHWYCADLQSINYQLKDSKINVLGHGNCSTSKDYYSTTTISPLSISNTFNTKKNIINTTYDALNYTKQIFVQNDKILIISNKVLDHILQLEIFLGCLCAVIVLFLLLYVSLRIGFCHNLYNRMVGWHEDEHELCRREQRTFYTV